MIFSSAPPESLRHSARPGTHSHNRRRIAQQEQEQARGLFPKLRLLLLLIGLVCLGFYGYTAADEFVYQVYENWAFDQQIAGNTAVSFANFVSAKAGITRELAPAVPPVERSGQSAPHAPQVKAGDVIGRISIARLDLSAVIREGVDGRTLQNAVGHVPSTAFPGARGNAAIAAHRDTLFRRLKDIRIGDEVSVESSAGVYTYVVAATRIVKPADVSVLRSDGGGLVAPPAGNLLTMITCYPFYYVGSAPKRFIVEAKLIRSEARLPKAA
jgi:sortase A